MEAAKLLEDGKGDFAKILERPIHNQIYVVFISYIKRPLSNV